MSFELDGPVGTYIYITADGLNGQSEEHLRDIRDQILSDENPSLEMVDALDVVLANPRPDSNGVKALREQGKFLLGVTDYLAFGDDKLVDGLLFAQGEDLRDSGAFSVVRMATWIRQGRKQAHKTDSELRNSAVSLGLTDIEGDDIGSHGPWGVPVERTTRIISLQPNDSERPEGYIYGHRKDFEAIEGLALPNDLKRVFADVAATWHEAELEGDSSALAESLRASLADWALPQ